MTILVELNTREPKPQIIARLLTAVEKPLAAGCDFIESMEFRRNQYGLTQREFAFILGMTESKYSELKSKKINLTKQQAARLFQIGVPAESILIELVRIVRSKNKDENENNS